MQTRHVVVWDPNPGLDRMPEGAAMRGPNAARVAETEGGIVLLPVDAALFLAPPNGCAGWARRAFGRGLSTGNDEPPVVARRFAPIALWVDKRVGGFLHWVARVVPAPRSSSLSLAGSSSRSEGGGMSGLLRLSVDPTQAGVIGAGLGSEGASFDMAALGPTDRRGGWTLGGRHSISSFASGFLGMSLHGTARGILVEWVAVSQSRE